MTEEVRVTHRDIAAKYGCDRSTVSLALNGHPRIREKVRREIQALADKMGYRPDPSLAMLARNRFAPRSSTFRASLAYIVDAKEKEPYQLQLSYLPSAKRRAEERGYQVFEFDLSAYPSGEAASNVLYQRGVQGLIIPKQPREVEFYFRGRGWERFSIVCCSLGWIRVPFHIVTTDVFEGTRLVWRRVFDRGYRRIGGAMFRHVPVAEDDYARHGASIAQQVELILAKQRIPLLRSNPEDKEIFLAWVKRFKPDAIISFISRPYDWLTGAGYRVPGDVAFACCNVRSDEHLTGLAIQDDELGRAAVDFLVGKIHSNESGIPTVQETLLLEPEWTEGTTLPRVDLTRSERRFSQISRKRNGARPATR